jgi:hypothetical protein
MLDQLLRTIAIVLFLFLGVPSFCAGVLAVMGRLADVGDLENLRFGIFFFVFSLVISTPLIASWFLYKRKRQTD